jgi:dipeptidyl-peptidase-3
LDILNTRAFKKDGKITITVGSISTDGTKSDIEFKGTKFDIIYGEFASYLVECNQALKECVKYCANETQTSMVEKYIEHYQTGNIETHKDS